MQHCTLPHCLGNNFTEKELRALACGKLIMDQQCGIVAKMASSPPELQGEECWQLGKGGDPSCLLSPVWHTWGAVSKLGLSSTRETWTYWSQSNKGP